MPETGTADAAARRALRLFSIALVATVVGAIVVAVTVVLDDDESGETSGAAGDQLAEETPIGPTDGETLEAYVARRNAALDQARGRRTAVISFAAYLTADEADGLLGAVDVIGREIALPADAPVSVDDDLDPTVAERVAVAREDRTEIERLLPTVTDDEFAAFYRDELDRLAIVAAARPGDAVVFAAWVVADADQLRTLAAEPRVRLVDVGTTDDRAVPMRGIRPDELARAGEPELRPG